MKKIPIACIIDDDPMHLYLTKHCIEISCLVEKIYTFKNGKVAFDALSEKINENKELPSIIFLDINMPVWDGWQFLEEFSKIAISYNIPIYLLTSSNSEVDIDKAKRYGLSEYFLIKPLNQKQLEETLIKHV
jgi:CheY-like chemotaxis protein